MFDRYAQVKQGMEYMVLSSQDILERVIVLQIQKPSKEDAADLGGPVPDRQRGASAPPHPVGTGAGSWQWMVGHAEIGKAALGRDAFWSCW